MKTRILIVTVLFALFAVARALAAGLTEAQQSAIRQEVHQSCTGLFAALERMDGAGAWAFNADTPDYVFGTMDGRVLHGPEAKENWLRPMRYWSAMKFTTEKERIVVLGPDTAVLAWSGTCDGTMKSGALRRFDQAAFTSVWTRGDDGWKIISFHQSSFLPRPMSPEASDTASAKTTATPELTAAEAAVREADQAWAKAAAAKSVEQTLAFYDPEALVAGTAMPRIRGLSAYREFWTKMFARPEYKISWITDRVVVADSGTMAYTVGHWATHDSHGPALTVWRKQADGQWKVLVDAGWYAGPVREEMVGEKPPPSAKEQG